MNDKTRNIILMVVLGVLLLGVYLWLTISDNNKKEAELKEAKKYSGITKTEDYELFSSVSQIIDDLNVDLSSFKSEALINKFSKEYLNSKALNSSNIVDTLNPSLSRIKKYVVESYYNCNKLNCYVFIRTNGVEEFFESYVDKIGDEYYLIKIDLVNDTYDVQPLEGVTNIKSYANSYHIENITIEKNDYNNYKRNVYNDAYIIKYYLKYIEHLLFIDQDNAANFINLYSSSRRMDYLTRLENVLYSYRKDTLEDSIKYYVTLFDGSKVTIVDYAPMNFKITFN